MKINFKQLKTKAKGRFIQETATFDYETKQWMFDNVNFSNTRKEEYNTAQEVADFYKIENK